MVILPLFEGIGKTKRKEKKRENKSKNTANSKGRPKRGVSRSSRFGVFAPKQSPVPTSSALQCPAWLNRSRIGADDSHCCCVVWYHVPLGMALDTYVCICCTSVRLCIYRITPTCICCTSVRLCIYRIFCIILLVGSLPGVSWYI